MTLQEIFDKVKTHLLTQNAKAVDPDTGMCQYRGPSGTMCAIGCLIPDEKYGPTLEGLPARDLIHLIGGCPEGVEPVTFAWFVEDLQSIHDNMSPLYWSIYLKNLANNYGLTSGL